MPASGVQRAYTPGGSDLYLRHFGTSIRIRVICTVDTLNKTTETDVRGAVGRRYNQLCGIHRGPWSSDPVDDRASHASAQSHAGAAGDAHSPTRNRRTEYAQVFANSVRSRSGDLPVPLAPLPYRHTRSVRETLKGNTMLQTPCYNRRRFLTIAGLGALSTIPAGRLSQAANTAIAPTPTMRGGANNYRPNAPLVDRLGTGFDMSGTVRRAGDGAPLGGQRIQIWGATTLGGEREPANHGSVLTDANGAFRLEMPQIVPNFGQPHAHLAYDDCGQLCQAPPTPASGSISCWSPPDA